MGRRGTNCFCQILRLNEGVIGLNEKTKQEALMLPAIGLLKVLLNSDTIGCFLIKLYYSDSLKNKC